MKPYKTKNSPFSYPQLDFVASQGTCLLSQASSWASSCVSVGTVFHSQVICYYFILSLSLITVYVHVLIIIENQSTYYGTGQLLWYVGFNKWAYTSMLIIYYNLRIDWFYKSSNLCYILLSTSPICEFTIPEKWYYIYYVTIL